MIQRRSLRLLAAALAGFLTAAAFPGLSFEAGAFFGPLALLALLRDRSTREGAALGGIFGIVFFGTLLRWLAAFGLIAVVPLAISQAAWMALFGALAARGRWGRRERGGSLQVALIFASIEVLRSSVPLGGFDWGGLGYASSDGVASLAPFGGVRLVGAWMVLQAAAVLQLTRCRQPLVIAGVVGTMLVPSAMALLPDGSGSVGSPFEVAVVQGNVPEDRFTGLGRAGRIGPEDPIIVQNHLRVSQALVGDTPPGLVIWPENSFDRDPRSTPDLLASTLALVDKIGAPFMIGAIVDDPDGEQRNANLLVLPERGIVDAVAKQHLVPFGETVPWAWVRRMVPTVREFLPTDLAPGEGSGVLTVGDVKVGSAICFESAYARDIRRIVRDGAQLVVVSTNNASYGRSAASQQHLEMTRMRALEHRKPFVQAAISGISAFITPQGQIHQATGLFEPALIRESLRPVSGQTWFARFGGLFDGLLVLFGFLGVALDVIQRKRLPR